MLGNKPAVVLCALACLILPESAKPSLARSQREARTTSSQLEPRQFAGGIPLRILPLGASIVHGVASSDGNGFRAALREQIVSGGNEVNMVGSNPNGTMADNDNSGWPGFIIDQVHTKSNEDTPDNEPNLVLVNAGTNDAIQNVDIPNAGTRMNSMLTDIYTQSPQATIILSTLIVNADDAVQARGVQINDQYKSLAATLQEAGKPIVLADMQGPDGPLVSDLSADGIHPDDVGYCKMANVWFSAISQANVQGLLRKAVNNGLPDDGAA
ncbi:SGNH hydrolase-type esterase domain-containing protein [Xylariales sp. AK1849]|nr:SGNH hydrolase-type esterase domain-containing protein [Xylariales sp. AK1849]